MGIKLIVGLRNPGAQYAKTRHNAGAWYVEYLAENNHLAMKLAKKLYAEIAQWSHRNTDCKIILPTTYMNHSGQAVRATCHFYGILPEEVLIVHDELDLDIGRIKLKTGGGHGGHNGLKDIITQLGSNMFHRLRVGIGHPGCKELVLNYVLGTPPALDRAHIMQAITHTQAHLDLLLEGKIALGMNKINEAI